MDARISASAAIALASAAAGSFASLSLRSWVTAPSIFMFAEGFSPTFSKGVSHDQANCS